MERVPKRKSSRIESGPSKNPKLNQIAPCEKSSLLSKPLISVGKGAHCHKSPSSIHIQSVLDLPSA